MSWGDRQLSPQRKEPLWAQAYTKIPRNLSLHLLSAHFIVLHARRSPTKTDKALTPTQMDIHDISPPH